MPLGKPLLILINGYDKKYNMIKMDLIMILGYLNNTSLGESTKVLVNGHDKKYHEILKDLILKLCNSYIMSIY